MLPQSATWETLPQSQSWLESAHAGAQRTGSVKSSTLNLTNTLIGAGMLGLPAAFAACGYGIGALMLCTFAFFSGMGLHLLSAAADVVGRPATFRSVAEAALPGSGLPYVIDAAIAIKCFGVATSYLVVVGDSVPKAIAPLGATGILLDRRLWVLLSVPILVPLVSLKKIDGLKYASMLSLACIFLVIVEILLFAIGPLFGGDPVLNPYANSTAECFPSDGAHPCVGDIAATTDVLSVLRKVPIFVFSYTCQQNIVSVSNEIRRPTPLRINAAIGISECIACSVYLLVGFCGYFTFGDRILSDVLTTYPESTNVAVARILMAASVVLSYGLQSHPSRMCILSMIGAVRGACGMATDPAASVNSEAARGLAAELLPPSPNGPATPESAVGQRTFVVVTGLFLLCSVAIALVVDDLGFVLSIVGATGSTTVSYLLPGFCYFRLCPDKSSPKRWLAFLQLALGCIIMPGSLVLIFLGDGGG